MPKDNENIRLPLVGPLEPSEPRGFKPDQMIRCEECLRANPPTRVSCFYCSATLPETESSLRLRKPTLRPPDKFEQGYNTILLRRPQETFNQTLIRAAADLLKLDTEAFQGIVMAGMPLPLARIASLEEGKLLAERLNEMGLETMTLGDADLGLIDSNLVRLRSLKLGEDNLGLIQAGETSDIQRSWSDIVTIVSGRLHVKRIEVKERKSRQAENEIVDKSEFDSDEAVVDLYLNGSSKTFRIAAHGFDFSCLQEEKALVANENISKLINLLIARATRAVVDRSFNQLRQTLEPVWRSEQEVVSTGWRRERPGTYTLGSASVKSNESQFTRYSRLCYYFCLHPES